MADKPKSTFPDKKELERELADYLSRKYGEQVKVVSAGVFPAAALAEEEEKRKGPPRDGEPFHFDLKPEELVAYLDEYVVRQDEAKAILATRICTHFNRIRYEQSNPWLKNSGVGRIKSNVLLVGPTGVGKTYLIKLIAQRIGVPFIKGDATKFSETGYVGGDVEDLVRDLVRQADGDIDRAQYGIIYIDEIDKIAASPNRIGIDVSRAGVQRALLKPMEETDVELKAAHDPVSQIEAIEQYRKTGKKEKKVINTRHILFIMSGAFSGLEEIIGRRTGRHSIGFENCIGRRDDACRDFRKVKAEDLVAFGFENEFVGRLPVIAVLDALSVDDLYTILRNACSSVLVAKKKDFLAYGIGLVFADEALRLIAERAAEEKTGARGLVSVLERVLLPYELKLPSAAVSRLAVTAAMVRAPQQELERLLASPEAIAANDELWESIRAEELTRYQEMVNRTVGGLLESFEVAATPERLALLARVCQRENAEPEDLAYVLMDAVGEIERFSERISAKTGVTVTFSDAAVDRALEVSGLDLEKLQAMLGAMARDFEYGLCLLAQKRPEVTVAVEEAAVDAPKKFMEDLVSETFRL
ncbi:MAG: AAA family ATPase [Thermodesulfobacteriota bacterium]